MNTPGDRVWRALTAAAAALIPLVVLLIAGILASGAWPVLRDAAGPLVTSTVWDPAAGRFGALAALLGTLLTSALALLIAGPLGIATAIFTVEIAPPGVARPLAALTDLLAAIPSVVYGLWGVAVLLPLLRDAAFPLLQGAFGGVSLFAGPAYGPSLLAASLLLAIMILPYVTAVTREVLAAVPVAQREAARALGATRWEVIRDAVLPSARLGITGGLVLALGRALGETMAVTMVIGNRHEIGGSLLAPGYSLAALLANEFGEAADDRHLAALMAVALLLLVVTLAVNVLARALVRRVRGQGVLATAGT